MSRQTWPNRLLALALLAGMSACGAIEVGDATGKKAPKDAWPERVEVSAAPLTVGTATGTLRWDEMVDGFAFSRFPITNGQYQDCITGGACSEPRMLGEFDDDIPGSTANQQHMCFQGTYPVRAVRRKFPQGSLR